MLEVWGSGSGDWWRTQSEAGLKSPAAFDPGDRHLLGVGGGLAVDQDVPLEVEDGGKHHHAAVVHPLARSDSLRLLQEEDINGSLPHVLWQVAEIVTQPERPVVPGLVRNIVELHLVSQSSEPLVGGLGLRATWLWFIRSSMKLSCSTSPGVRPSSEFSSSSFLEEVTLGLGQPVIKKKTINSY